MVLGLYSSTVSLCVSDSSSMMYIMKTIMFAVVACLWSIVISVFMMANMLPKSSSHHVHVCLLYSPSSIMMSNASIRTGVIVVGAVVMPSSPSSSHIACIATKPITISMVGLFMFTGIFSPSKNLSNCIYIFSPVDGFMPNR